MGWAGTLENPANERHSQIIFVDANKTKRARTISNQLQFISRSRSCRINLHFSQLKVLYLITKSTVEFENEKPPSGRPAGLVVIGTVPRPETEEIAPIEYSVQRFGLIKKLSPIVILWKSVQCLGNTMPIFSRMTPWLLAVSH